MIEGTPEDPIKLLWTGGWDSTFRLLQILLQEKKTVQPIYILDHHRKSLALELQTMQTIRDELIKKYSGIEELFLPTYYYPLSAIKPDVEIQEAYNFLYEKYRYGSQYLYLASFCKQNNHSQVELSIEKAIAPEETRRFFPLLDKDELSGMYYIKKELMNEPIGLLFKYYRFPIYDFRKIDMQEFARKNGWLNILKKTWFCLRPIHGKISCGTCHPCKLVIEGKLQWRIPIYIRVLNKLSLTKHVRHIAHWMIIHSQRVKNNLRRK